MYIYMDAQPPFEAHLDCVPGRAQRSMVDRHGKSKKHVHTHSCRNHSKYQSTWPYVAPPGSHPGRGPRWRPRRPHASGEAAWDKGGRWTPWRFQGTVDCDRKVGMVRSPGTGRLGTISRRPRGHEQKPHNSLRIKNNHQILRPNPITSTNGRTPNMGTPAAARLDPPTEGRTQVRPGTSANHCRHP